MLVLVLALAVVAAAAAVVALLLDGRPGCGSRSAARRVHRVVPEGDVQTGAAAPLLFAAPSAAIVSCTRHATVAVADHVEQRRVVRVGSTAMRSFGIASSSRLLGPPLTSVHIVVVVVVAAAAFECAP